MPGRIIRIKFKAEGHIDQVVYVLFRYRDHVGVDAEQMTNVTPCQHDAVQVCLGDVASEPTHAHDHEIPEEDQAHRHVCLIERQFHRSRIPCSGVENLLARPGMHDSCEDGVLETVCMPVQPAGQEDFGYEPGCQGIALGGAVQQCAGVFQRFVARGQIGMRYRIGCQRHCQEPAILQDVAAGDVHPFPVNPGRDIVNLSEERHQFRRGIRDGFDSLIESLDQQVKAFAMGLPVKAGCQLVGQGITETQVFHVLVDSRSVLGLGRLQPFG